MAKLEYGEDYTEIFTLFAVVVIVISILFGKFGVISIPIALFYLAAVQLYSGIALASTSWWRKNVVARYTRQQQPDLFYLIVAFYIFGGIVFSIAVLTIFQS